MDASYFKDPVKRAYFVLDQMKLYLRNPLDTPEYKQVEILFTEWLNVISETHYGRLTRALQNTQDRLESNLYAHSLEYWQEYLRFMHWKLTGRVE